MTSAVSSTKPLQLYVGDDVDDEELFMSLKISLPSDTLMSAADIAGLVDAQFLAPLPYSKLSVTASGRPVNIAAYGVVEDRLLDTAHISSIKLVLPEKVLEHAELPGLTYDTLPYLARYITDTYLEPKAEVPVEVTFMTTPHSNAKIKIPSPTVSVNHLLRLLQSKTTLVARRANVAVRLKTGDIVELEGLTREDILDSTSIMHVVVSPPAVAAVEPPTCIICATPFYTVTEEGDHAAVLVCPANHVICLTCALKQLRAKGTCPFCRLRMLVPLQVFPSYRSFLVNKAFRDLHYDGGRRRQTRRQTRRRRSTRKPTKRRHRTRMK